MQTEPEIARERQLVEAARRQPEAFREIYRTYFPRVFAYVAARVDDRPDVEDLVSAIFLRMIEGIRRFDDRGSGAFTAWVFRIAHNAVIDFHRERRRRDPSLFLRSVSDQLLTEENLVDGMLRAEVGALLRSSIAGLSPRRREVILLKFFAELRNQEIAVLLQLDERSVAAHLSRALDDMARALHDSELITRSAWSTSARLARLENRHAGSLAPGEDRGAAARYQPPPGSWPLKPGETDRRTAGIDLPESRGNPFEVLTKVQRDLTAALDALIVEAAEGSGEHLISEIASCFALLAWPAPLRFKELLEARLIEQLRVALGKGPADVR